jgi:hypothetical protein
MAFVIPPYQGLSFTSGTRLEKVECLRAPSILDADDGGEYAVLAKRPDGTTSVWYATLLPGYAGFSYWPTIEDAFPHGTGEGREAFVAAKMRFEGKKLLLPSGESVSFMLGDEDA